MDKEVHELIKEIHEEMKLLRKDVDDLLRWKAQLTGIFVAVAAIVTFLINEIKTRLGIA